MTRPARAGTIVLLVLAAAFAVTFAVEWLFPLQVFDASTRGRLWTQGVKQLDSAGLQAYVVDRCNPAVPTNCRCIALIHGLSDSALTWDQILLRPPRADRKLVALDLPGSGRSPGPRNPAEYSVRRQAERVREALTPLCPHWMVVGNSLGGWVSAWLAAIWPEGVDRLLLVDAAGLLMQKNTDVSAFPKPTAAGVEQLFTKLYAHPPQLSGHVWQKIADQIKATNAGDVLAAQQPGDAIDLALGSIRSKTLVLWGERDGLLPAEQGWALHTAIPGSLWRSIPDCGHAPQKECPSEVISAISALEN